MVVLPPSTGKSLAIRDADCADELSPVDQDFIDAVFQHNGRPPPRPTAQGPRTICEPADDHHQLLQAILRHVDADCGYDDWLHVGMALHHETGASDEGYGLFDTWSSTGDKYQGVTETRAKWGSFRSAGDNAYTIGTLFWLAKQSGYTKDAICAELDPFEECGGDHDKR